MTLTMEILRLLVRTSPVDDASDPVFEVIRIDSCSVRTHYRFRLNPFSIKSPFFLNNVRNRYFFPNPIDKMKIHVREKLYQIGLVTIPCNNQDYFKNNEYIIVQLSILVLAMTQYRVILFLNILCQYIFYFSFFYALIFQGFANVSIAYFFCCSWFNFESHFSTSQQYT